MEHDSKCDNCGKTWMCGDLEDIRNVEHRVEPGGIVPSGECPECGCLCYPIQKPNRCNIGEMLGRLDHLRDFGGLTPTAIAHLDNASNSLKRLKRCVLRSQIAAGTYETPAKVCATVDAILEVFDRR